MRRLFYLEEGSALIEYSIALILTMTMLLGALDFAHIAYVSSSLNAAAQAGARAGIVADATDSDIIAAVRGQLVGLDDYQVQVEVSRPQANRVEVSISYSIPIFTPLLKLNLGAPAVELQGSAGMLAYSFES